MATWSPHVIAAAEAMFKRLRGDKSRKWSDLDAEAADHYCAAAKVAVDAFHKSAAASVDGT